MFLQTNFAVQDVIVIRIPFLPSHTETFLMANENLLFHCLCGTRDLFSRASSLTLQ
jgi:hypothetical protein